MKPSVQLPELWLLNQTWEYDPETGGLYWKRGCRTGKLAGCVNKDGHRQVTLHGRSYAVHRIVWKMYHRQDPVGFAIRPRNDDFGDCRIENLLKVEPTARKKKKTARYEVDEDGVGRYVVEYS